jgi:hypothetical protein
MWLVGGGIAILVLLVIVGVILWPRSGSTDEATAVGLVSVEATEATSEATEEAGLDATATEPASALAAAEATPTIAAIESTAGFERLLEGDILLQESFNSNDREWTILEYEADFGFYSANIVNGRYRLSREATEAGFNWEEPATIGEFDNFIVTLEASPTKDSDPFRYGLVFRSNPIGFYTFELSNEGDFRVRANDQDGWHVLVEPTAMPTIKNDEANQLAVQADGPILTFFINGAEATTVEDTRFSSGKVAVLIDVEAENSASVDYDNFIVRELSNNR